MYRPTSSTTPLVDPAWGWRHKLWGGTANGFCLERWNGLRWPWHYVHRNEHVHPHRVSHSFSVRTSDALLRNICNNFLYDAHLYLTFLSDHFKCLMLFTNLRFSSIFQRCCMIATNYNSFWCIFSVFASHQYCCFCVVKEYVCAMCTNQAYKR